MKLITQFFAFIVTASSAIAANPPNIVFILSDDHTSQAWGCYGGRLAKHVKTPNIDRIAKEGALLENCFCTNSICVPSRATILTGQYSHKNKVKTLRDALDPKADNVAKRLRAAGYQTALVGKWHLKKPPAGFDYWNIIKGQGRYHNPVMYEMDLSRRIVQPGSYCTDLFTTKALGWLNRRDKRKPFCLMLHFKATHEPWQFHPRTRSCSRTKHFPNRQHCTARPVRRTPVCPDGRLRFSQNGCSNVPGMGMRSSNSRQKMRKPFGQPLIRNL